MSKLESGLWQYNKWLHQILDLANILNCSFFGSPCSTSKITDHLAKCKAKQIVSFVGIFFMPWVVHFCIFYICSCLILVQNRYFSILVRFCLLIVYCILEGFLNLCLYPSHQWTDRFWLKKKNTTQLKTQRGMDPKRFVCGEKNSLRYQWV